MRETPKRKGILMKRKYTIEEILLAITMGIMTLLTAGNVIARKLFHSSFSFVEEITIILFIVATWWEPLWRQKETSIWDFPE